MQNIRFAIPSKMSYFDKIENLKLLQNLLATADESSEPEADNRIVQSGPSRNPVDNQQNPSTYSGAYRKVEEPTSSAPSNVDDWEKFEQEQYENSFETRKTPEYRISYKQAVAPEDIFLRMGNKTAATASCEEMCLEIELPDETMHIDQMQLDVNPNEIELRTGIYHLKLPLAQRIDADRSKATWDTQRKMLRLLLRMKREFDFINF